MKRKLLFLIALAVAAPLPVSSTAYAFMRQAAQSPGAATDGSSQPVQLEPMVVTGLRLHSMPLPVKLQMLKAALNRPVNLGHGNLSKLVCRFDDRDPRNAERHPLFCETNCDILQAQNSFAHITATCGTGGRDMFNEQLAAYINSHPINRKELMALLKKLPPADSSYTFQIKSHGKVVARWVIKDGQVVKVEVRKKDPH